MTHTKPENRKPELMLNIGKRCVVTQSVVAGLSTKECTIKGVSGNDIDGYRYDVELDKPLYEFTTKTNYYPPVFLCEVL